MKEKVNFQGFKQRELDFQKGKEIKIDIEIESNRNREKETEKYT